MKQLPGIKKIEYKIFNESSIFEIPFIKEKAIAFADAENSKAGYKSKIKLTFSVVQNANNLLFWDNFIKNINFHLLFLITFINDEVRTIGSSDFKPEVSISQDAGKNAGDFIGYNIEIIHEMPLYS